MAFEEVGLSSRLTPEFINSGLRGHKFVKEGAKEVLKRALSPNRSAQLLLNRCERFDYCGLRHQVWVEHWQALHHAFGMIAPAAWE